MTYKMFIDLYSEVKSSSYPNKSALFKKGQSIWNDIKSDKVKLAKYYAELLQQKKTIVRPKLVNKSILQFVKPSTDLSTPPTQTNPPTKTNEPTKPALALASSSESEPEKSINEENTICTTKAPAQLLVTHQIANDTEKLLAYKASIESGICTDVPDAKKKTL